MRYHFHVLTGAQRIPDVEGEQFETFAAARNEAVQVGRDMLADILREGRTVPAFFQIAIADAQGNILESLPATALAFEGLLADRYRRVFEAVPQPCVVVTPSMDVIDANAAYLNVVYKTRSELQHRNIFKALPAKPGDSQANATEQYQASVERVLRTGASHDMGVNRHDMQLRDGSWRKCQWVTANTPVFDENGEVDFIVTHVEALRVRETRRDG